MSDCSGSPSDHQDIQPPKRKAAQAGIDGNTTGRSVKRRASKACQCCRARKVRCNVTEHGAPCTNCRLDEVECIVSESRRKKSVPATTAPSSTSDAPSVRCCWVNQMSSCKTSAFDVGPLCEASQSQRAMDASRRTVWNLRPAARMHSALCSPRSRLFSLVITDASAGSGTRTTSTMLRAQRRRCQAPIARLPRARPWTASKA